MAITIDYQDPAQYVISVPKADTILVQTLPSEVRSLNLDAFRLELADLQDEPGGVWASTAFLHTPPLTISGVTLARVIEILDPYVLEFEDGLYSVNITGGNSNLADVLIKNQVAVNTANSAGLQDPFSLQAAAFGGAVAIDVTSIFSGTTFPIGTRSNPVNNIADAKLIADLRGLHQFQIMSSMTLSTSEDLSRGYEFRGDSPIIVALTLDPSVNIANCEFTNLTVTGTLDGSNSFERCHIQDINFFNGAIHECSIEGTITLGGGITAELYDCWSGVAGSGMGQTAEIDMGGSGQDLLVRNYSGGLDLINCTGASDVSIDMNSGRVIFDPTISAGSFWVRGVADVYDGSTGTADVQDQTSSIRAAQAVWDSDTTDYQVAGSTGFAMTIMRAVLQNKTITDSATGIMTVYDDDDVTPLFTAQLYEDPAGTLPYDGDLAQPLERRERLE